jgi:hypothetical protein
MQKVSIELTFMTASPALLGERISKKCRCNFVKIIASRAVMCLPKAQNTIKVTMEHRDQPELT